MVYYINFDAAVSASDVIAPQTTFNLAIDAGVTAQAVPDVGLVAVVKAVVDAGAQWARGKKPSLIPLLRAFRDYLEAKTAP